jgi:hypothetical protein
VTLRPRRGASACNIAIPRRILGTESKIAAEKAAPRIEPPLTKPPQTMNCHTKNWNPQTAKHILKPHNETGSGRQRALFIQEPYFERPGRQRPPQPEALLPKPDVSCAARCGGGASPWASGAGFGFPARLWRADKARTLPFTGMLPPAISSSRRLRSKINCSWLLPSQPLRTTYSRLKSAEGRLGPCPKGRTLQLRATPPSYGTQTSDLWRARDAIWHPSRA